jgi:hypothetical protein
MSQPAGGDGRQHFVDEAAGLDEHHLLAADERPQHEFRPPVAINSPMRARIASASRIAK